MTPLRLAAIIVLLTVGGCSMIVYLAGGEVMPRIPTLILLWWGFCIGWLVHAIWFGNGIQNLSKWAALL